MVPKKVRATAMTTQAPPTSTRCRVAMSGTMHLLTAWEFPLVLTYSSKYLASVTRSWCKMAPFAPLSPGFGLAHTHARISYSE